MYRRLGSLALVAALAACTSEGPTAVAAGTGALPARGSSGSTAVLQVAGTWAGTTINTSSAGVSAIKRGSVSGQSISLELDRGEGAEVAPTFFGTVESDGVTMVGVHSRYAETVTLVRR